MKLESDPFPGLLIISAAEAILSTSSMILSIVRSWCTSAPCSIHPSMLCRGTVPPFFRLWVVVDTAWQTGIIWRTGKPLVFESDAYHQNRYDVILMPLAEKMLIVSANRRLFHRQSCFWRVVVSWPFWLFTTEIWGRSSLKFFWWTVLPFTVAAPDRICIDMLTDGCYVIPRYQKYLPPFQIQDGV